MTSNETNMWSTSLAKPHNDYIYWCYAVELVSPKMKCHSCTQPKFDRFWNMHVSHGILAYLIDGIGRVQIRAMHIIFPGLSYGDALVCSQLPKLKDRRDDICLRFFKSMEKSNHKLHHLLPNSRTSRCSLRKPHKYESTQPNTNRADGVLVNWCLKHFSNSI